MAEPCWNEVVRRALVEDRAREDVTARLLDPAAAKPAVARLVAEAGMVVAGLPVIAATLGELDPGIAVEIQTREGDWVEPGTALAVARGPARILLAGERVVLNLLQRLSGIATATRQVVKAIEGTRARITHTRKTTPGLRDLELYAVRIGGGVANRASLADAVLWKDNHWALLTSPAGLGPALAKAPAGVPVIVEVENGAQVEAALAAGVTHLLVDNQPPDRVAMWATRAGPGVTIQVSGGITTATARAYAEAGAALIAVGWITHSAPAAPIRCDLGPDT
ncbi:MAG: carboxylating nicotinate-nucleotide diphosphorylase [Gemmatimonadales bacterium]